MPIQFLFLDCLVGFRIDTHELQRFYRPLHDYAGIRRNGHEWQEPSPEFRPVAKIAFPVPDEIPLTVRQAAVFLGVSAQTVYLWVERKQIPHLRVMGRNIRFLKSELEPFRSQFKYEVENGQTKQA